MTRPLIRSRDEGLRGGSGRPRVEIEGLRKTDDGLTLVIESLVIREGEFITFLGPDGSGKTTLMRILGGFLLPDEGTVLVDGRRAHLQRINDRIVRDLYGDLSVFPHLPVARQLALAAEGGRRSTEGCRDRIREWIERLELHGKEQALPDQLTPQERLRLALGRAWISEPRIVMLDVPRLGIDPAQRIELWRWIDRLSRHVSSTFLVATHDPDVALTRSRRIAVLDRGVCVQVGAPRRIYLRPATETVERLVAGANVVEWNGNRYAIRPEDIEIGDRPLSHRDFQGQAVVVYGGHDGQQTEYALAWREELLLVRSAAGDSPPLKRRSLAYFGWDAQSLVLLARRIGLGMLGSGRRGCDYACDWNRLSSRQSEGTFSAPRFGRDLSRAGERVSSIVDLGGVPKTGV